MTTIREIQVQSIGEPYQIKIEKNSKGYNYEVSIHAETAEKAISEVLNMRNRIEEELYGNQPQGQ
jgi:hypothetical protein